MLKMQVQIKNHFFILTFFFWGGALFSQSEKDLLQQGLSQLEHADYAKANKTFYTLKSRYNRTALYHYYAAVAKVHLSDYSSALVDLNKSISLDPDYPLAYSYRYLANKETRNFQFALADISRYLEYVPNDTLSRWARYELAIYMREYDDAINDGKWLIAHQQGGDSMVQKQIHIFEETGRNRDKLKLLTQQININSDQKSWYYQRAFTYYELGEYETSLKDLEQFLVAEPKNRDALKLRFDNHFYLRNLPKCERYIKELIELDRKNGTYYSDYGHVLLQKGDWKQAIYNFDKAIDFKSSDLGYVYLGRGIARYNSGDKKLACMDWERSLLLGESVARKYLISYCER